MSKQCPGSLPIESSAERELGESLRDAPFVGDSLKDLQAAIAFGCQPILVRTGKGEGTVAALESTDAGIPEPDTIPVYRDLAAAAEALLAQCALKGDMSETRTK